MPLLLLVLQLHQASLFLLVIRRWLSPLLTSLLGFSYFSTGFSLLRLPPLLTTWFSYLKFGHGCRRCLLFRCPWPEILQRRQGGIAEAKRIPRRLVGRRLVRLSSLKEEGASNQRICLSIRQLIISHLRGEGNNCGSYQPKKTGGIKRSFRPDWIMDFGNFSFLSRTKEGL